MHASATLRPVPISRRSLCRSPFLWGGGTHRWNLTSVRGDRVEDRVARAHRSRASHACPAASADTLRDYPQDHGARPFQCGRGSPDSPRGTDGRPMGTLPMPCVVTHVSFSMSPSHIHEPCAVHLHNESTTVDGSAVAQRLGRANARATIV